MDYKQKIQEKGIKAVWLANQLGISKALMSFYLTGTRPIPEDRKQKLEQLLS